MFVSSEATGRWILQRFLGDPSFVSAAPSRTQRQKTETKGQRFIAQRRQRNTWAAGARVSRNETPQEDARWVNERSSRPPSFDVYRRPTDLGVPRVAGGRAGRRHRREDVRLAEGGEADLALGFAVRPFRAGEDAVPEHDESGAEGLGVEEVSEGDSRQVASVADEARLLVGHEDGLDLGGAVLLA